MYKAMGLDDEDLNKPIVAVSSTCNEATPCNIHLGRLAQKAKEGVKDAKCTPREFTAISVSDIIAMGHEGMKASLVSREVIADSIELMMRAHQYDGIVGIAGCDKSLPGTLMAMARLNLWQASDSSRCFRSGRNISVRKINFTRTNKLGKCCLSNSWLLCRDVYC
jgi:dihydroxy-acid dehydratase